MPISPQRHRMPPALLSLKSKNYQRLSGGRNVQTIARRRRVAGRPRQTWNASPLMQQSLYRSSGGNNRAKNSIGSRTAFAPKAGFTPLDRLEPWWAGNPGKKK
jgi:hypothetical protein